MFRPKLCFARSFASPGDHLSRPGVSARLVQPTRNSGVHIVNAEETSNFLPCGVVPAWPCSRWGLPGRGCCQSRRWSLTPPFHPGHLVPTGARGCLFLWPDPAGFPAPGVTRHRALWSADFPLSRSFSASISDRPTGLGDSIILSLAANVNCLLCLSIEVINSKRLAVRYNQTWSG
jgi:hypothetical protein